jgi:hypothetical protein
VIVHGGWWLIFIGEKYEHHQTPEKEEKGWNKGKDYKRSNIVFTMRRMKR